MGWARRCNTAEDVKDGSVRGDEALQLVQRVLLGLYSGCPRLQKRWVGMHDDRIENAAINDLMDHDGVDQKYEHGFRQWPPGRCSPHGTCAARRMVRED